MALEFKNKIIQINYNWFVGEFREEFQCIQLGATYNGKRCTEIIEHYSRGEGDKWFYDVYFDNGTIERIFNINKVFYNA